MSASGGSTNIRRALPAILSHPQLVAGLALIGLSLVPLLVASASGNIHTAKVIAAHMIACGLAWLLVSLVIMAVHWHGEAAAERLLDGLFIASVVTVAFAVFSLAFSLPGKRRDRLEKLLRNTFLLSAQDDISRPGRFLHLRLRGHSDFDALYDS